MGQLPKEQTRIFEAWIGEQNSGKSLNIFRRVLAFAFVPAIEVILVCDTSGVFSRYEFGLDSDGDEMAMVFKRWVDFINWEGPLPRVCIFKFGSKPEAYAKVWRWAIDEGDCLVVLDEAARLMPAASTWTASPDLQRIVFEGRHLENFQGIECTCGLIIACQYARLVQHMAIAEANTVYCSHVSGERNENWVRGYAGKEALERVQGLERWRWTVLKGSVPGVDDDDPGLAVLELDAGDELLEPFEGQPESAELRPEQ